MFFKKIILKVSTIKKIFTRPKPRRKKIIKTRSELKTFSPLGCFFNYERKALRHNGLE